SRGVRCPTQPPGYQALGWAYSLDYGQTFTDGGRLPVPDSVNFNNGDPWLTTGPDGTIYMSGLWRGLAGFGVVRGTVTDTGIAWDGPTIIEGTAGGPTYDKEALAVDPNTGIVYLTYTRFGGPGGIYLYRSFDGAQTFQGPFPVATGGGRQGSQAVVGPNNELYVIWTNTGSGGGMGFAVSYDNGTTFTPPRQIAPQTQ